MEENNIIKPLKEGIIAIIVAYTYINLVVGISPFFLLLLPVPFIVLGIRNNIYVSIGGMTLLTVLLGALANTSLAMSFFIIFMPFIITVLYFIDEKKEISNIIFTGAVIILLSLILILSLESRVTGINLAEEVEKGFSSMIEIQVDMFKDLDFTNSEINRARDMLESAYEYTVVIMPSIFLIMSLLASYLNYKLSTFIVNHMGYREISIPDFSLLKLPDNILIGTATIIAATIIINRLELDYHNALVANVGVLLGVIFLIQGLSLASYLLKSLGMGKFMRTILIIMNTIFFPVRAILMIAGFADSIFDFRKIRKKAL